MLRLVRRLPNAKVENTPRAMHKSSGDSTDIPSGGWLGSSITIWAQPWTTPRHVLASTWRPFTHSAHR
eukprot:4370055-Lingulodinium_polyedra.AAC.1